MGPRRHSCVLDLAVRSGTALETASIAEFEAARRALERAKFDTSRIVFDSPAKTLQELRIAVYSQCFLNVDNFQELERVAQLHVHQPVTACIGIRINPQVGAGIIAALSTGVSTSKFGIGLDENREALLAAFKHHSYFENGSCSHRLTGSQLGCNGGCDQKGGGIRSRVGSTSHRF